MYQNFLSLRTIGFVVVSLMGTLDFGHNTTSQAITDTKNYFRPAPQVLYKPDPSTILVQNKWVLITKRDFWITCCAVASVITIFLIFKR